MHIVRCTKHTAQYKLKSKDFTLHTTSEYYTYYCRAVINTNPGTPRHMLQFNKALLSANWGCLTRIINMAVTSSKILVQCNKIPLNVIVQQCIRCSKWGKLAGHLITGSGHSTREAIISNTASQEVVLHNPRVAIVTFLQFIVWVIPCQPRRKT